MDECVDRTEQRTSRITPPKVDVIMPHSTQTTVDKPCEECGQSGSQAGRQADRQTGRQADRQGWRQTGRGGDRQASRQTGRQTGRGGGIQTSRRETRVGEGGAR